MAYTKTVWGTGDPITAQKMDKIETALANISAQVDAAATSAALTQAVNNLNGLIGDGFSASRSITEQMADLSSAITSNTGAGARAWSQLVGAGVLYNGTNDTYTKTLKQIFDLYPLTSTVITPAINTPSTTDYVTISNERVQVNTLARRIKHIYESMEAINTVIDHVQGSGDETPTGLKQRITEAESDIGILQDLVNGTAATSITERLDALDGGNIQSDDDLPTRDIKEIITELENAHYSTEYGTGGTDKPYTDIDSRFEFIEKEIAGAHIANGGMTLDGRFDLIDGGSKPSRTLPNVIAEITEAHRQNLLDENNQLIDDTLDHRFDDIETNITDLDTTITNINRTYLNKTTELINGLTEINSGKALDARQGKVLNDRITDVNTALDSRLDALEAARPSTTDDQTGETTYGTLDDRFDAVEDRATQLETDVNTIASELSMYNTQTHAIEATNSRVSTIESNVVAMAKEIGMLQDESSVIDLSTAVSRNDTRIDTIDSDLNTATTGIKARLTAAETNINSVLGKDTIVINKPVSGSNYTNDLPNLIAVPSPSADADYLIADDDGKYFYWRYINNNWQLISGAGGSGTSSAEFYANLNIIDNPSETVDYFIGSNSNYIHYRYLNNQWVMILPNHLINSVSVDSTPISNEENAPTKSRPIIKELNSNTNLLADFKAIQSITSEVTEEGTKLTWINIDGEVEDVTIAGGGGSSSGATATITRVTNGSITTIAGETCNISFKFIAKDASGESLETTSTGIWSVNRARVATSTVYTNNPENPNSYNTFDITQYLRNGDNDITLTVNTMVDDQIISRTKTWTINVINFSLTWEYDESIINDNSTITFSCTPYGIDISKTLHLKIGQNEQTQTVTTSGIPVTITIENNFSHGTYTAEMWMTATINDHAETTNSIFHDFIVAEANNTTPIIAATLPSTTIDQYNTLAIPFVVYTPTSNTSNVTLAVDGTTIDTREVGRTIQTWYYTPTTLGTNIIYDENEAPISGTHILTITTGSVTKALNLTVNAININNDEIGGYVFKLKASELSSNNMLQNWCYDSNNPTTTKLQFSDNFDWINGGIKTELDENNQIQQYIRVKSGTTMTIPYKIFATDPRTNGANFKIIFKIDNCRDYDATIATNIAENIGIQLNAHGAIFKSTTTQINTQYGEEEYTELEFEVYKSLLPNGNDAPDQYMMAWVDGVIATARAYGGNFVQTNENAANFIIGSTDCDVCIYLVKYYPKVLSRNDHITNFIADAPNAVEMMARYHRNDILDADEDIDYNKLAHNNQDCRVWLYDIARMTKSKDDSIDVYNFQQIWEGGDQYYQLQGTNAKLKIQGTSSVNYRYGAANTDIDFRKSKAPNATLIDGYGNDLLDDELEYKGFKINDNSIPIEYSNTKVNFASCEQVNNMCNAEWYQRYQPFPSLSARDCMEFVMGVQFIKDHHTDEPVDGINLFTEKGADFDPEKYYMYSIANMGTSKKNTHIFHSENECCIEIKENTSDAQKMKSFDSAWTDTDKNTQNYEMRYPDIKPTQVPNDIKSGWARFVNWMVASNPGAATNAALPESVTFKPYTFKGHNRSITNVEGRHFEQVLRGSTVSQYAGTYDHDTFEYRMAKMLSECEDYMAMDSVVYHFCFIERHTMVDNVAKNTFWSSVKEIGGPNDESGYWIWDLSKNYDNDTSDGNNNNGLLVFDYGNEASDTRDGTPVFNGYDSVWFVFVSNLYEACQTMFTNRETIGAWNSVTYHNYLLSEQHKVPERVWNECYWYDYLRTYENNIETTWINFLDGGQKTHQRKHYETYEEIYDSSKYRGSFSHNQSITLRGEAIDYQTLNLPAQESRFTITMFNKCYLTIWIGTNYQTVKCAKGIPVTLNFYEDNDPLKGYMSLANSVIDIDSGSMVQAIGDLSLIYPSSGQFGAAKRLRSLQIGSDTVGYYNPNMNTNSVLTFNNKMLEYLYVQNLPQATYNLDLSNCPELKYLDASGSGFTGFVFANGGLLNEAYINNPTSLVMRNLNYLTKTNFHLTSPTAVTSLRLEGCKLFDNYTFINELTNLNVLRLTNIDWTLSTNTLLERLVDLMGIDGIGSTTSQSYLSGNISLTGIVYEGDYNKYNNAWSPDLVIDATHASQFINQHLIIYNNYDGTELYRCYIDRGSELLDPYESGLVAPTKEADVENRYVFGGTDYSDRYTKYSGWRYSSNETAIVDPNDTNPTIPTINVNGDLILYAVFRAIKQKYTVRWLVRDVVVKTSSNQELYGGGYTLAAPTIKEVQAAGSMTYTFSVNGTKCSYSIMTGWEKLPTNIQPTQINQSYDIHATWLERNNVEYSTVLNSSAFGIEEKLLVLKEISAARSTLNLADIYPITLGYTSIKPAIDLRSTPKRYVGTVDLTQYEPFGTNKSFTLMIDYRFEQKPYNSKSEAILLSCYDSTDGNEQGFKLYYDPTLASPVPQISFGNVDRGSNLIQVIGNSINNRGIVVLRHRAGENILYIYTGSTASGLTPTYTTNNFRKTITWSGINTNAKLVLGGTNISNASWTNAYGTLYDVKYWEEDLGDGECTQLANWCHETINFAIQDWAENASHSAIVNNNVNIVLHTLNASEMGIITEPSMTNSESSIGWNPSNVRDFYNNRLYQALPIAIQSIMTPIPIIHKPANYANSQFSIGTNSVTTYDYVFAPSCVEVGVTGSTFTSHATEAADAFGWYSNTQMKVLHYSDGQLEDDPNENSAAYTNLRFPYCYNRLNTDITIYKDYPSTASSFYGWLNGNGIELKTGDILLPRDTAGDGITIAYIYVAPTEIENGAPYVNSDETYLSNTRGGWIPSIRWWTRSVPDQITPNQSASRFMVVKPNGDIGQGAVRQNNGLVYSIAL